MSTQWLAAQSFQQSQDLLTAINTLSIHLKLRLVGVPDEGRMSQAQQSRRTLMTFVRALHTLLQEAQQGEMKPLVGVDPRQRHFVKNCIEVKRDRRRFRSALFQHTPAEFQQLLSSDTEEDRYELLECLKELRTLLEEHVATDAAQILENA